MKMNGILEIIKDLAAKGLVDAIKSIACAVKTVFEYFSRKHDAEQVGDRKEEAEKTSKLIDDACEKGDISDLINAAGEAGKAKKSGLILAIAAALVFQGCITQEFHGTRPFEGRYDTAQDAIHALESAGKLGRNESIWILSSETMKIILKRSENY